MPWKLNIPEWTTFLFFMSSFFLQPCDTSKQYLYSTKLEWCYHHRWLICASQVIQVTSVVDPRGKAGAKGAADAFKVARSNAPDYGGIGEQIRSRSLERQAATAAEAHC